MLEWTCSIIKRSIYKIRWLIKKNLSGKDAKISSLIPSLNCWKIKDKKGDKKVKREREKD